MNVNISFIYIFNMRHLWKSTPSPLLIRRKRHWDGNNPYAPPYNIDIACMRNFSFFNVISKLDRHGVI